jgi:hypothetical protein
MGLDIYEDYIKRRFEGGWTAVVTQRSWPGRASATPSTAPATATSTCGGTATAAARSSWASTRKPLRSGASPQWDSPATPRSTGWCVSSTAAPAIHFPQPTPGRVVCNQIPAQFLPAIAETAGVRLEQVVVTGEDAGHVGSVGVGIGLARVLDDEDTTNPLALCASTPFAYGAAILEPLGDASYA